MNRFLRHALALALSTFGLLALAQAEDTPKPYKNVDVPAYEKLRADGKAVLLDVRTPGEFKAGHIPGAINLDINEPDFEQKVGALAKDKVYLVNCAMGGRSARACSKMAKLKFSTLYNLDGGFTAWEKAGLKAAR